MTQKLYLPQNAKNDFYKFCKGKINDYNIKNITQDMINKYFDYCIKKETFTTLTGYTKVAGEEKTTSINKIFLKTGQVINNINDIVKFNKNEYNINNYDYICEHLFNDMFCEIEWMTRSKNDYEYANKIYTKVFAN